MKRIVVTMIGNIWRPGRTEAGDTLIEVTIALSILSMVLISSTVIAVQAFRLGQTARERTTVSTVAQAQMEAVRGFRDNHTWDEFLHGTATYHGMLTAVAPCTIPGTPGSSPCMHMVSDLPTYTPADGVMAGPIPTSNIDIVTTQPSPDELQVTVNYWFQSLGSGMAMGHIKTSFSNLKAGPPPTPAPIVLPPIIPNYTDCEAAKNGHEPFYMDLADYPPYAPDDWHVNYVQPGVSQHIKSTIPFVPLISLPSGNYAYWAVSKDTTASGSTGQSLHYLLYNSPNGKGFLVGTTADTPPLSTSVTLKQASVSGIFFLSKDVKSIMVEHATRDPSSTDDGVDSACLVLRPL